MCWLSRFRLRHVAGERVALGSLGATWGKASTKVARYLAMLF